MVKITQFIRVLKTLKNVITKQDKVYCFLCFQIDVRKTSEFQNKNLLDNSIAIIAGITEDS